MLKRIPGKLAFQGMPPAKDPARLIKMTGFADMDEATLLGALLDMKAHLSKDGVMEELYNKGCEAIRVLAERKAKGGA